MAWRGTRQQQRGSGRCQSRTHGLLAGERANEDQLPLTRLRTIRFTWAYLFGAACPERGVGAAIVMPEVNIAAMNAHLAVISRAVSVGTIAVTVLDGASWHASPRLKVPDNIVLLPQPPYAPELNPIATRPALSSSVPRRDHQPCCLAVPRVQSQRAGR